MRSLILLETTIAATLLVASGVTLAHHLVNTVYCPTSGWCEATDESEHIYGTDAKESIFAGDGDDQVDAFAGDDTVYDGGYGDDALYGGEGWDSLYGALGDDKLFGASGQDDVYGDAGNDYLHGGSERDLIEGYFGKDHIRGGGGGDEIYTGRIPRRGVVGPDGVVDTVECGSGFDTVYYEKGRDRINSDCEKKKPYSYQQSGGLGCSSSCPSFIPHSHKCVEGVFSKVRFSVSDSDADGVGQKRLVDGNWISQSPDGERLVYTTFSDVEQLAVMNEDGSGQRELPGVAYEARWSPNGKRVAYVTSHVMNNEEIYVMNTDGTDRTRLTDIPGYDHWPPTWSPDGTRIAFTSDGTEDNGEIYVVNSDATGLTKLTGDPTYDSFPAWRP